MKDPVRQRQELVDGEVASALDHRPHVVVSIRIISRRVNNLSESPTYQAQDVLLTQFRYGLAVRKGFLAKIPGRSYINICSCRSNRTHCHLLYDTRSTADEFQWPPHPPGARTKGTLPKTSHTQSAHHKRDY